MDNSVTVGIENERVALRNDRAGFAVQMRWEAALEVGHALAYKARGIRGPESERLGPLTIRRDGEDIIVEHAPSGRLLFLLPLAAALEIGHALLGKAHEIEEQARAADVTYDQAILSRLGVGLGLAHDRGIREQAARDAAWDSRLRRYIRSSGRVLQSVVGRPTVLR